MDANMGTWKRADSYITKNGIGKTNSEIFLIFDGINSLK
jgi:hypothetical protein